MYTIHGHLPGIHYALLALHIAHLPVLFLSQALALPDFTSAFSSDFLLSYSGSSSSYQLAPFALKICFALASAPFLSCLGLETLPLATSTPLASAIFSEAVSCLKFYSLCFGKFRFQILALRESFSNSDN